MTLRRSSRWRDGSRLSAWRRSTRSFAPSRETVYLPDPDAVLVGARVRLGDETPWLLYDCGKNAWYGVELAGADPIGKGVFNNSMGLMYDPNRKVVWAVGQNSHVRGLRFEAGAAKLRELE